MLPSLRSIKSCKSSAVRERRKKSSSVGRGEGVRKGGWGGEGAEAGGGGKGKVVGGSSRIGSHELKILPTCL
jgi:hypothetical protein